MSIRKRALELTPHLKLAPPRTRETFRAHNENTGERYTWVVSYIARQWIGRPGARSNGLCHMFTNDPLRYIEHLLKRRHKPIWLTNLQKDLPSKTRDSSKPMTVKS